jgi:ATP-dependent Clp protease protease subunit
MTKSDTTQTTPQFGRLKDRINGSILQARRIFISGEINSHLADEVIRQLWYLDHLEPKTPILLVINSGGGSVDAGFAIWDQIHMISSPVSTLVTGIAASMGSILSLAAKKGKRLATPYTRIMLHQPAIHGVVKGQATDLEIHAREILKTRQRLVNLYVKATGKKQEEIDEAIDRDLWMTAEEALKFGLLDKIVHNFDDIN